MNNHDRKVMEQAFKTGDRFTAIYSIQSLLTRDTANYGLMDTLTKLYIQLNDYRSAFYFSRILVKNDSTNVSYMEDYARCARKLNLSNEAIDAYSFLYEKDNNSVYLYEIAIQKLNQNKVEEAQQIIAAIFNDPRAKTDQYLYPLSDGRLIKTPVIAAAHFLMGTYMQDVTKNTEQAEIHYKTVLEYAPGFFLASQRLSSLNQ